MTFCGTCSKDVASEEEMVLQCGLTDLVSEAVNQHVIACMSHVVNNYLLVVILVCNG